MVENTKIEWAHHTFNPWEGCTKVGPGCDHCYAERRNSRFHGGNWGPGAPRRRTAPANWAKPRGWNRQAAELSTRYRVFCASLADVFDNEVDPAWRTDLFQLIRETPHLDWLLLTKRIGNVAGMLPDDWVKGWPNVWLGATVVNQAEADRDIPKLLATPAALRWLSMEPLLGPVTLQGLAPGESMEYDGVREYLAPIGDKYGFAVNHAVVDWVIVGGESGPSARPIHPDWARSLRDQCVDAGAPFLFKQWGEHLPEYDRDRDDPDWEHCPEWSCKPGRWLNLRGGHGFHGERVHYAHRLGKARAGRLLDGQQHDGFPASPVEDH